MNSPKELFFIVNEHSGSGKGRKIEKLVQRFQHHYAFTAELHKTTASGHAHQLAERIAERAEKSKKQPIIVAVGGDGTLNEVISGLNHRHAHIPVGCIPTGSGNDFARSHDLPLNPEEAFEHLLSVHAPTRFDVLTYSDNQTNEVGFAANSLGFGIDAAVIHLLNQSSRKEQFGKISYLLTALSAFFRQQPFSVTVRKNGKEMVFPSSILVLASNNPYFGGGLKIHPQTHAEDGKLDLVIAEKLTFLELVRLIGMLLTKGNHLSHPKVHTLGSDSFSLKLHSDQFGQKDGEELPTKKHDVTLTTFKQSFWI